MSSKSTHDCCSPEDSAVPLSVSRPVGRRGFLAGAAAVSGTILWSSLGSAKGTGARAGAQEGGSGMQVGRAMADITGEPWGAGMNGYAVMEQTTIGIQRRQYARAFVFVDSSTPQSRVAHVTIDIGLMFQSVQLEVLRRLRAKFGDLYGEHNVLMTATHTHVAPGGTSQHLMVDLTTMGFRPLTFEAQVAGIVDAISRAHEDISPAELTFAEANLEEAGINRSKQAFDQNPAEDRDVNPTGVDTRSVTLNVFKAGKKVGFINWHSLHPVSMDSTYQLISGDNKGYAAWATEHEEGVDHRHPEQAEFVAAFANATPGDITPNMGLAPMTGPGGEDVVASARIMGERTRAGVDKAGRGTGVDGSTVASVHKWVDCSTLKVDGKWTPDGKPGQLTPAILGAAFAASSQEDGGGEPLLGFNEGARGGTPWVKELNKVSIPPHVHEHQSPKEMLLPMGYLPGMIQQTHCFHVTRIGGLVIASLGFEPTITSGLRLRRTVAEAMDVPLERVIVQGYTSGYGHYITTPEEYSTQNYEGGATAFGRLQLPAFQQVFHELSAAFAAGEEIDSGKPAGDLTGLIPKSAGGNPWLDVPPAGRRFGDVISAPASVAAGALVTADFVAANPNNNLRHGEGYTTIESPDGRVIADDSSESTLLTYKNEFGTTTASITWDTTGLEPGEYTLRLQGDSRDFFGKVAPFEGVAKVQIQ